MHSSSNPKCPVCGRVNRLQDQCSFCGANLSELASVGREEPEQGTASRSAGTLSERSEERGPASQTPSPSPHAEGPALSPRFAGFWIRTVAYLIDGFVLLLLMTLLIGVGIFGYVSGSGNDTMGSFSYTFYEANWGFMNIVGFVLNMAYFTFFLGTRGQTPGKMICGLKVVRTDGNPVTFLQAAVRTLGYYVNHFTLFLGFLWVAFDPRKQGLHDKIAGTYEIRLGLAEVRDWQPPLSG